MNEITVTGLILSVMPIGEYDRRTEILTDSLGRISAFARGARKPGSSLVSVTRVFAFGTFHLYQGKSSYSINSAEISDYFDAFASDLECTGYGFYFLELARYFSRENVEASDMLKLLFYSLKALERTGIPKGLIRRIYELKMLHLSGLCPSAERLAAADAVYAFAKGISGSCLKAFRYVTQTRIEKLFTFRLSPDVQSEFDGIVQHLLKQSVDREFRSEQFLEIL
ncbi:MAG: DNA repair protein RecO [Parasporobacterium sp.]|nr:DNA repair protein RecO [Parasporobacterium sp.]